MAVFIPRFLRHLRDVDEAGVADGDSLTYDLGTETWVPGAGGGGGVTDHGALTGLADNDHPQYQLAASAATDAELAAHDADTTNVHGIADTSVLATDAELAAMLDQAVILAPASSARNVILPANGDTIAAIIQSHADWQTGTAVGDMLDFYDENGVLMAGFFRNQATDSRNFFAYDDVNQDAAGFFGSRGMTIFVKTAATENPIFIMNQDGSVELFKVLPSGVVAITPSSYPAPPLLVRGATSNPDFSRVMEVQDSLSRPRFYFELFEKEAGDGTDTYLYLSHGMGHGAGEFSQIDWNWLRKDDFGGTMSSWAITAQSYTDTSGFWGISPYNTSNPVNYPFVIDWATSVVTLGANAWDATDRGGAVLVTSGEAGRSPLLVRAAVGGTVDILGLLDSSHVVLSRFNKAGYFMTRKIAAPADGDLVASELAQWFDSTNGAAKFMLKGKTVDGTVATWEFEDGIYSPGGGGAPTTATYITQTPDAGLSAEQALSALATGLVKNTTGTGVLSIGAAGTDYYAPGGTDVALADGGTGASTATAARTNLQSHPYRQAGYKAGEYYTGEIIPNLGGTGANGVGRAMYTPFIVDVTTTFDRIAIYITANATAGGVQRMGIYNDNNGVPGTVLLDAGTVAVDAGAAAIKAITISQQLPPGRYWLCSVAQTAAPTVQRGIPTGAMQWLNTVFNAQAVFLDGVTGALGNNPAVGGGAVNPTVVALRALSSP